MLFNFTPGVSGQALAGLISSASCPAGRPLSSASLKSPEKGCSRGKTYRQGDPGELTSAGQTGRPDPESRCRRWGLRTTNHRAH